MIPPRYFPYEFWPTHTQWRSILLGLSGKLGLPANHTALCHLASIVARRKRMGHSQALDYVIERTTAHVHALLLEFVGDDHATLVAHQVHRWLCDLAADRAYGPPLWPTIDQLLSMDRAAAAQAGFDGRFTLSTNLARLAIDLGRTTPSDAIRWVHARIAAQVRGLAKDLGFDWFEARGLSKRLQRALDSFDRR